jgi:glycosyltransferase involved in cell wall biosynthesis
VNNIKISVIIPIYNGGATLFQVLRGFERQTFPRSDFEVVAVDDYSTDDTWQQLQAFASETALPLKLVRQTQSSGISATRNLGAMQAHGNLLLFVDQDCLPAPDLIERHVLAHANHVDPIAVGGKIIWSTEFAGTEAVEFYKQIYFPVWEGINKDSAPFYYFITSNASVSREGLLDVGAFDSEFRHLYADVIGGWRLQQEGYRIILDESAVVYTHRDLTLNEAIERYREMGREMALVVRKYPELVGILTEPGELLADSYVKQTLYRLLSQYATAKGLTEGLGHEFPDQTLNALLEQAALLKSFETWRDRRLELYVSELVSLRQDKEQQLKYVRQVEGTYQRQRDELDNLIQDNLELRDYAAKLEQEIGYSRFGFNLAVLTHNLLSLPGLLRRIRTKIKQRLAR